MSPTDHSLTTGLDALDLLMGGGLPARQMALVSGQPGSGKTILASQAAFALAARGGRALLTTATSEPHTKILETLHGFSFFDRTRVGKEIVLLSAYPWLRKGAKEAREMLLGSVREQGARLLVVDGLRALYDLWQDASVLREFLSELGVGLATCDCTAVLTLEHEPSQTLETIEAATVDAVINLYYERGAGNRQRRVEVVKVRGRHHLSGEHHAHLGPDGFRISPRLEVEPLPAPAELPAGRAPFLIPAVDQHLGGGVPSGGLTVVTGHSGAGKSLLGFAFARGGAAGGAPALLVSVEETEAQLRARAAAVGLDGRDLPLEIWSPDPLLADPDGIAREILRRVGERRHTRVVVDGADLLVGAVRVERRRPFVVALARLLTQGGRDVLWTGSAQAGDPGELGRHADNVLELGARLDPSAAVRALRVVKLRAAPVPDAAGELVLSANGWEERRRP